MARVLLVGLDPGLVDYSDPSLPPGLTVETVRRGIAAALDDLRGAGHDTGHLFIPADPNDLDSLSRRLADERTDCVVIGGGVRLPPPYLTLFEAVVNTIARSSPAPAIALIARPEEALVAVARVLARRPREVPEG